MLARSMMKGEQRGRGYPVRTVSKRFQSTDVGNWSYLIFKYTNVSGPSNRNFSVFRFESTENRNFRSKVSVSVSVKPKTLYLGGNGSINNIFLK